MAEPYSQSFSEWFPILGRVLVPVFQGFDEGFIETREKIQEKKTHVPGVRAFLWSNHQAALSSVAMSITKRYFTSLLSMRS